MYRITGGKWSPNLEYLSQGWSLRKLKFGSFLFRNDSISGAIENNVIMARTYDCQEQESTAT